MFVDSHCHLEMEDFDRDLDVVVRNCVDEGLEYVLTVGTEESYFEKVRTLIERHPFIYGAVGIHPHNARDFSERIAAIIREAAKHPKIVGYGEVGLDFFKNHSPREVQEKVFIAQLGLAQELKLPIIVHSREAKERTLDILKKDYPSGYGVIHCYSYDVAAARQFLDMGFFISIPGTVTYKTAGGLREVVRFVPVDRLLAETDAPFLSPVPHRGKRNIPSHVKITIEAMAKERGVKTGELAPLIRDNFVNLFLNNPRKDRS